MTIAPTETTIADDSPAGVLRRVLARIEDPAHWTQKTYARSATGRKVKPDSPRAVAWCLEGARVAEAKNSYEPIGRLVRDAAFVLYPGFGGPIGVNDKLGHDAALAVLRRAIELAEPAPRAERRSGRPTTAAQGTLEGSDG